MSAVELASIPADFWLQLIRRKATTMRYGSLEIVVQDGQVTLVEAIEKSRLPVRAEAAPDLSAPARRR